ncbi:MAG: hypothetical protein KDK65_06360 [Chlamydiia bacterium]|nr:hypothetical protein [Chlamydiia bacterium]
MIQIPSTIGISLGYFLLVHAFSLAVAYWLGWQMRKFAIGYKKLNDTYETIQREQGAEAAIRWAKKQHRKYQEDKSSWGRP